MVPIADCEATRTPARANIFVQGSPADLEEKLRKVWGE